MQKITVICVGKLSEKFYAAGIAEYFKRLQRYCKLDIIEIAEERIDEGNINENKINAALEKEAEKMVTHISEKAQLITLCIAGRQFSSEEFAENIKKSAVEGISNIVFAIGSSHGLAKSVQERADIKLSFSKMTFPHQLARLVLLEQIYRAYMIQSGGKYHK